VLGHELFSVGRFPQLDRLKSPIRRKLPDEKYLGDKRQMLPIREDEVQRDNYD
jgi:hypothetical protein